MKLQKASLLILVDFSETDGTKKMTKSQLSNIIGDKWEMINRNFTASSGLTEYRSVFDMHDPNVPIAPVAVPPINVPSSSN